MDQNKLKNKNGLTEEEFLKAYDPGKFERPSVTVDMLLFTVEDKKLKLLMIKRGDHPCIGKWALPGGFVEMKENLDQAALRELKEETGIEGIYMEQLYTWGNVDRDPRTRIIGCSYMALVDGRALSVKADDDAADAKWFDVECRLHDENKATNDKGYILDKKIKLELKNEEDNLTAIVKVVKTVEGNVAKIQRDIDSTTEIAFDHAKIIEYAIETLRNKVRNTGMAAALLPELFTLNELLDVYEAIFGMELSIDDIMVMTGSIIEETDQYRDNDKTSKLYKYNL